MTSMPSDSESNVSGFVSYGNKNFIHLYKSMIQNMELINQDLLEMEKNLAGLVKHAGPLEGQLNAMLLSLPKQQLKLTMETE